MKVAGQKFCSDTKLSARIKSVFYDRGGNMKHRETMLLVLGLIGTWGIVGAATAQEYYADNFSQNTIGNYESAGGAKWQVKKGELVSEGAGADWNVLLVKKKFWKGWTDYTYEVKVVPKRSGSEFIYITFRYTQKLGVDRQNFFTYLMDGSNVVGLYIDKFLNGARTRPVPNTMTFEGKWKNEKDVLSEIKLEVTSKTISGYLNGKQQFKPIKDDNLVDGRIGLGIWGRMPTLMIWPSTVLRDGP
jgi:hypothetical protein